MSYEKIYYMDEEYDFVPKTPVYQWIYNADKTLVVRVKISDGTYRWYFNGVFFSLKNFNDIIPSNLQPYARNNQLKHVKVYVGDDLTQYGGQVGFSKDYSAAQTNPIQLGLYDLSYRTFMSGLTAKGIFESTGAGTGEGYPWEEPTFDPYTG